MIILPSTPSQAVSLANILQVSELLTEILFHVAYMSNVYMVNYDLLWAKREIEAYAGN